MIEVKDLTKSFEDRQAVRGISFAPKKGQIFGLLGPNGAGKTTTIRMIMNIITPDSGEILLDKEPLSPEALDHVGYLPEERGLYIEQSVFEVLKYLTALKRSPKTKAHVDIIRLLDRLDLVDYADQKIRTLSRGNQQKVQIIAAIAHNPDLVILDEPFSGLDPINQNIIRELIVELRSNGKCVILSSHQMELVESLCDYISLINKGEIILEGPLKDIRRRESEGAIAIEAEGDLTFLSKIKEIESLEYTKNGAIVHLHPNYNFNAFITDLTKKVYLLKVEKKAATLKDIYLNTIKKHSGTT